MLVYADNASTTKMSKTAIATMQCSMEDFYGNPSSLHSIGQKALQSLDDARGIISNQLGCHPREILFTSGGSESDNQAIISAANLGAKSSKKHIISSKIEHHAVIKTLKHLEKQGFRITLLDVDSNGIVNADDLLSVIDGDTCLVSIMYANNEIGTIQPITEIANICSKRGILFHTDAVQAVGKLNINVGTQNIDMLSFSAHKFHGPKGVGALYCRKGIDLSSIVFGGTQERGKRAGTENLPAIMSMAKALEEECTHLMENNKKVTFLRDKLIHGLTQIPNSFLNGDLEKRLAGNVNIGFKGVDSELLLIMLDTKGICASYGSACSSGSLTPSHVLLCLGLNEAEAKGCVRFSLSHYNTEEEIDYIIKETTGIVKYLRNTKGV